MEGPTPKKTLDHMSKLVAHVYCIFWRSGMPHFVLRYRKTIWVPTKNKWMNEWKENNINSPSILFASSREKKNDIGWWHPLVSYVIKKNFSHVFDSCASYGCKLISFVHVTYSQNWPQILFLLFYTVVPLATSTLFKLFVKMCKFSKHVFFFSYPRKTIFL